MPKGDCFRSVGMSTPGLECKETDALQDCCQHSAGSWDCVTARSHNINSLLSQLMKSSRRIDASVGTTQSKEMVAGGWTARDNFITLTAAHWTCYSVVITDKDTYIGRSKKNLLPNMGIAQNRKILDLGRITRLSNYIKNTLTLQ